MKALTTLGLVSFFGLFSSALRAQEARVDVSGQVYAESGCSFYYVTRAAFKVDLDLRNFEQRRAEKVEFVELVWGHHSEWTPRFGLNVNPQRISMSMIAPGTFSIRLDDLVVARKGRYQLDTMDFLFHVQLGNGDVIDVAGPGYGEFFSVNIPYQKARCSLGPDWQSLPLRVLAPWDRNHVGRN
jgi:hypothetical protein